jgi:hypothetical protein
MNKPKKKRKGDANQVAYSVVQDVIKLSEREIKPQSKSRPAKRGADGK